MKWIIMISFCMATGLSCVLSRGSLRATNLPSGQDSMSIDRAKHVAEVKERIRGKEKMEVGSVFKNLTTIGGFRAELLPVIMEKWSMALGVSCNHCHEIGKWESDLKPEKNIARKMAGPLTTAIGEELSKIEGLSEKPIVNCATCHRGQLKPAIRME